MSDEDDNDIGMLGRKGAGRPPNRPWETKETVPRETPPPTVPRDTTKETVQSQGYAPTADQWSMLIDALKSNKAADIEAAATVNARAMKKALRPENEIAPGVSAYNPKGERDFPRPKPTQIFMLARYPICEPGNYDTTTWTEIELLNQIKGGAYMVTKADGTDVEVLVKGETDSAGRPYKMTLFADGKGIQDDDQKNNWPPLLQILTQMVMGERPDQSFARYQAIIDRQAAELAALKAASAA